MKQWNDLVGKKICKTKNWENVPCLEFLEVVLVYGILIDNYFQQKSEALYTLTPDKSAAYLSGLDNYFLCNPFMGKSMHVGDHACKRADMLITNNNTIRQ